MNDFEHEEYLNSLSEEEHMDFEMAKLEAYIDSIFSKLPESIPTMIDHDRLAKAKMFITRIFLVIMRIYKGNINDLIIDADFAGGYGTQFQLSVKFPKGVYTFTNREIEEIKNSAIDDNWGLALESKNDGTIEFDFVIKGIRKILI